MIKYVLFLIMLFSTVFGWCSSVSLDTIPFHDGSFEKLPNGLISNINSLTTIAANQYEFNCTFNSSQYLASDLRKNDIFVSEYLSKDNLYFRVDSIFNLKGDEFDIRVTLAGDQTFNVFSLSSSPSYIFRPTNNQLVLQAPATSEQAKVRAFNASMIRIDSIFNQLKALYYSGGVGGGGGAGDNIFDSNRPILRTAQVGDNIGGTTVQDWLEYWYFTEPTISLFKDVGASIFEIGTSTTITFTTTVTNTGNASLSSGLFTNTTTSSNISSFGSNTSSVDIINFTPRQGGAGDYNLDFYGFQSTQSWSSGSESGTASSNSVAIRGVYPLLYGMGNVDTSIVLNDLYNTFSATGKIVEVEGNKTVSLTGSGLIYFAIPSSWSDSDLSQIIDPNGFNVLPSFDKVTYPIVNSAGLDGNWSLNYTVYYLNTGTTNTNNSSYTIVR